MMVRLAAMLALTSLYGVHARDAVVDVLDSLSIMAVGPLDGRAVIKTSDNKMHVLKPGDVIPGTKATVSQILTDKLVVDDVLEDGHSQTVWITKGGADGKVTVQRLSMEGPAPQIAPQSSLVYQAIEPESKTKNKKKADK